MVVVDVVVVGKIVVVVGKMGKIVVVAVVVVVVVVAVAVAVAVVVVVGAGWKRCTNKNHSGIIIIHR